MTTTAERQTYLEGLLKAHRARIGRGERRAIAHDLPVRLLTVSKNGVRIRFADGHIEVAHPEDVR